MTAIPHHGRNPFDLRNWCCPQYPIRFSFVYFALWALRLVCLKLSRLSIVQPSHTMQIRDWMVNYFCKQILLSRAMRVCHTQVTTQRPPDILSSPTNKMLPRVCRRILHKVQGDSLFTRTHTPAAHLIVVGLRRGWPMKMKLIINERCFKTRLL
jgi:hypothetical protein